MINDVKVIGARVTHLFDRKENYYRILAGILVVLYGFLFTSRIIIHLPNEFEDTPLRQEISGQNLTAQMTEKTFFEDRNLLQIGLIINDQAVGIPKGYEVNVREKSDTEVSYKNQLIKITDDYHLLFVHGLPENWQSISIQIFEAGTSDRALAGEQKLYVANPKTKKLGHFKQYDRAYYADQYYALLIEDNKKNIEKENRKQKGYENDIHVIEDKINSLKDELSYQTGSKKQETQNDIVSQQSQLSGIRSKIDNTKKQVKELNDEIKLLEKKREENRSQMGNK